MGSVILYKRLEYFRLGGLEVNPPQSPRIYRPTILFAMSRELAPGAAWNRSSVHNLPSCVPGEILFT